MTIVKLFREEVVEGFYRGEFIVLDIEDGVELGNVQHVADFLGKVEQFQFASRVADCGKAADELADARTVEVVDVGKVQDDFLLAMGEEIAHRVAEFPNLVTQDDAPVDVEDGDVRDFAAIDFQRHVRLVVREW